MFREVFLLLTWVLLAEGFLQGIAHAELTHSGKLDVDLVLVDSSGGERKIDRRKGEYHLDWKTGKCELQLEDKVFAYCNLDLKQDLKAPTGQLLVSSMPQAHFTGTTIDGVLNLLGQGDKRTREIMAKIVQDTSLQRTTGFDLPMYTCETCTAGPNGKIPVWNAYDSFVFRTIEIHHPLLLDQKLVLKFRLHAMRAIKGAFPIIGSNAAGNFGTH